MNDLSTDKLRELLGIRDQIEKLQEAERRIMSGKGGKRGRKRLSAASKKKLSQKMKAVWAKRKADKG